MDNKVPMPPTTQKPLFLPLEFWLDAIAYLDKRVEIIANGGGFGMLEMSLKLREGKIYEMEFEEKISVRDVIKKAGNHMHQSVTKSETTPASMTKRDI